MYRRILLAYDGSESCQKILLDCHGIAQRNHSELFLIAVRAPVHYVHIEGGHDTGYEERDKRERQEYKDLLEGGLRRISCAGYTARGEVAVGKLVDEIIKYARKIDADLIVVGRRHLAGCAAPWRRSSTARLLVEHAHCSVLVVITH